MIKHWKSLINKRDISIIQKQQSLLQYKKILHQRHLNLWIRKYRYIMNIAKKAVIYCRKRILKKTFINMRYIFREWRIVKNRNRVYMLNNNCQIYALKKWIQLSF